MHAAIPDAELDSRGQWAIDWGLTGFVTAFVVPLVGLAIYARPLLSTPYVVVCAVLGVPSGALVGLLLWTLRRRLAPRSYRAMALLLPPVLGVWGAGVASLGAAMTLEFETIAMAWPMGSIAAMLQTVWLAPSYPWWIRDEGRRDSLRWLVLPVASGLVGVVTPLFGIPIVLATSSV